MAQVKKLQQGGTLNINGKEYTVDQINEYLSSGQFDSQERAALAGTVRAIQEGKSRYLDANSNSLSGDGNVNEDFADYFGSERRANRGRSGWSVKKQNRHATKNTDFATRDSALAKLGGIENYFSGSSTGTTTVNPSELGRGSGWFYTDGKYVSGPQNLTNEKHIRNVFDYLAADENGRRNWKLSGWGDAMDGLSNWYTGQNADDLISRIRNNRLTDEDMEVLSYMGYAPTEEDVIATQVAYARDAFTKAGYDYDKWSGIIDIDENGQATVRKGEDGKTAFSSLGGNGNYFFNDSFAQLNPDYAFLKDHFVIDGKLYKASDASVAGSELYNILRTTGGFYDKNKSGDWEGADQIIKHLWDGRTNYALGNSDVYSQFLHENPNYRWTSITGAYDVPLSEGEQLIEYYNPEDAVDDYGYGTARWAVLDNNGNFVRSVDSRGNATGQSASALSGKKIAKTASGNSTYDGLVIEDLVDKDGESTGVTLFKDPDTGDFIYRGRIRGANVGDNQDYIMPQSIAQILNKPEYASFWDKLKSDRQLQRQFERTLGDTINSGFRDMFTWNTMSKKNWMELGFSKEDAKMLVEEFDKYASNAEKNQRSIRRANRLIDQIEIQRNGGTISKFQPGGAVGTTESKGHTEKRLNTDFKHADNFAAIGDGEWEGLTGADWAEIGALVADMTGLGLGLTGAPIASGVAGAIGSTAAFGADLSRDTNGDGRGFEWGDVGSYAVNLGLDAISLIGAGSGAVAQGAKVAKAIQKSAKVVNKIFGNPIVMKSLAAAGIGSAVSTSAQKIINGEDWTVRDIRNVLNGLSGAMTLRKTGIFQGHGTKGTQVEQGTIDVKIKGSDNIETVTLRKGVLDNVNKPNTKDVDVQLKQAIVDELNARPGAKKVTVDDIDLTPAKVKTKRTWRHPIKGEPTDSYDFQIKEVTQPGELLPTVGSEATRRGVVDQFNNWLKTGEFVEVHSPSKRTNVPISEKSRLPEGSEVGRPKIIGSGVEVFDNVNIPKHSENLTEKLNTAFRQSFNMPWKMPKEYRRMLRRVQIFTPNLTNRGDNIMEQQPAHFVPIPTVIVPGQKLSQLASMKHGGIVKAQTGLKFSDWAPEVQQRFKDARAAAMAAGKDSFDFEGTSYGLKKGADLPVQSNMELPSSLTSNIPTNKDALNAFRQSQGWQTEYTAPTLPDIVSVTEDVIDEPTLAEDLAANNYSKKLIRKQQRWQNKAAADALSMSAGNAEGEPIINNNNNISDIFRFAKLGNALSADKFQRNMAWNTYTSTMRGLASNGPEHYNRFQDYGVGQQYRNAAESFRKPFVNTHSDVNAMFANQMARTNQAINAELEGGLKQSQLYSDWLDQTNEAKRTYAQRRMEVENANRQRAAAAENAYWTQLGASRAQRQNVIDNVLTEQLGLYTQDRAMNYQLADQNESMRYQNEFNRIQNGYKQQLSNAIASGTVSQNTTLDEYLAANPNLQQQYTDQISALSQDAMNRRMDNYKKYNQQSMFFGKKGGKVSSTKRNASEQIWIDNQKINADAVKQLSKQALEFLKIALS